MHRLNVQGPVLTLKFSFITIVVATEVEACVHHVRSMLFIWTPIFLIGIIIVFLKRFCQRLLRHAAACIEQWHKKTFFLCLLRAQTPLILHWLSARRCHRCCQVSLIWIHAWDRLCNGLCFVVLLGWLIGYDITGCICQCDCWNSLLLSLVFSLVLVRSYLGSGLMINHASGCGGFTLKL